MKSNYYVYHLVDPKDQIVFYVGKGSGNRANCHESQVKRNPSRYCKSVKDKKIISILSSGNSVKVRIVRQDLNEIESLMLEEEEISRIGIENITNIYKRGAASGGMNRHESAGKFLVMSWLSLKDCRISDALGGSHGVTLASLHKELEETMQVCLSCEKMRGSFIEGMGVGMQKSKHSLMSII